MTGLLLGVTYEARARVAIWAGDDAAVERYARLTAQEYRHGTGSPLGARYERLMDEARRTVALPLPKLRDFESTRVAGVRDATAILTRLFDGVETKRDRGARILEILCSASATNAGHLYLCTPQGPTLVASYGTREPEGLFDYVCAHLTRDLEASDGETAIVSAENLLAAESVAKFTDDTGTDYRPLFLTALVDEVPRHAAIAVLVEAPDGHRPADFALTAALASHLIEAGDTPGIAARA